MNSSITMVDATKGLRQFEFDNVFTSAASQSNVFKATAEPLIVDFVNGFNAVSERGAGALRVGISKCMATGSNRALLGVAAQNNGLNGLPGPVIRSCRSVVPRASFVRTVWPRRRFARSTFPPSFSPPRPQTCLVYGQTGSGKTHTMFGPPLSSDRSSQGIVPRSCAEIFRALEYRKSNVNIQFDTAVKVSYVEIYGDEVTDLLSSGVKCGQSKVSAQRYVLSGAAERTVENLEDVNELLALGDGEKRRAATAMNDRSSRAHCLFILSLTQTNVENNVSCTSKLFLADLGGSEQVKKSGVAGGVSNHIQRLKDETMGGKMGEDAQPRVVKHDSFSTGFKQSDRLREAVYINLGLLALKKCVASLNDTKSTSQYVPYQDR